MMLEPDVVFAVGKTGATIYLVVVGGMIIGLGFLITKIPVFYKRRAGRFGLHATVKTTGIVVDRKAAIDADARRKTQYFPVVSFNDQDGMQHTLTLGALPSSKADYKIGQRVDVLYPPDCPKNARLTYDEYVRTHRGHTIWAGRIVMIVGGGLAFLCAALVIIFGK